MIPRVVPKAQLETAMSVFNLTLQASFAVGFLVSAGVGYLCIALLLRYLQLRSRFGWSMSNLVALLRMNLFTHRDLHAWIDEPFAVPPDHLLDAPDIGDVGAETDDHATLRGARARPRRIDALNVPMTSARPENTASPTRK